MNPLLAAALGSIIRWGLAFLVGYIVRKGIWTPDEAAYYVSAASLTIVGLLWSLWTNYKGRVKFLTALHAPPGTSEQDVKNQIADGLGVSVSTRT